jgi:hypothetical protein
MNALAVVSIIVASTLVTAGAMCFVGAALGWKRTLAATQQQYATLLSQAMAAQRESTRVEEAYNVQKSFIENFLQKEVHAVLNDHQFAHLLEYLDAKIEFEKIGDEDEPTPKKKPN